MSLQSLVVKNFRDVKQAIADIEQRGFPTGGLPGQVPTKISSADYDWTWTTPGVRGLEVTDADTDMIPSHANLYLSFTFEGAKTYTVLLSEDPEVSDVFVQWGVVTLRNSAAAGNLVVGEDPGVTLSGDQSKLVVAPGKLLQLVKADTDIWHIL